MASNHTNHALNDQDPDCLSTPAQAVSAFGRACFFDRPDKGEHWGSTHTIQLQSAPRPECKEHA